MNFLAGFTGLPAQITKIAIMAILDAVLVSMFFQAIAKNSLPIAVVIGLIALAANLVYFSKRTLPLKFLIPGVILLVAFVVIPVVYTVSMSVFNYKTGNEISKKDALVQLLNTGLGPDVNNTEYQMVLGMKDGQMTALITNLADTKEVSLADKNGVKSLNPGAYSVDPTSGAAISTPGLKAFTEEEAASLDSEITKARFPKGDGTFVSPQGVDYAILLSQAFTYDEKTGILSNSLTGKQYQDNGTGNFANIADSKDVIFPGWRAFNYFQNYTHLFTDPNIRGPFIGVFIWSVAFSLLSVLLMFAVGLLLAIILNRKIALRRFYRSIVILPYAIPSLMSILIWAGMFNRQFGAINGLLGTHIDWLGTPWLARGVVILVNLWLGIPYFYLISSGALQAIPSELEEAASLDGASPSETLRLIKLPLILQILSPLIISSIAFNFNNFNIIYLLTGGGPTDVLSGKTAGATDILITYTYKTAFGSNEQNLGLACAISMIIFVIVGSLSMWSLRRSKVLDSF